MSEDLNADNVKRALFRDSNFLWLLSGASISMLGDQLTLIALPWLVLKMTGDPLALAMVVALGGLPRALFMLVGGALVDRHDAKRVLMCTKHASAATLALLVALLYAGQASLWAVGMCSMVLGVAAAFGIPAATSLLPHALPAPALPPANGVMLGLRQLSMFVGPMLAGGLIVWFGDTAAAGALDTRGISAVLALDALSFAASAWTLSHVRIRRDRTGGTGAEQSVWALITEGLRWCWHDRDLRACFLYWSAIAMLVTGPMQVALPVLVSQQPGFSAAAFGVLMGAHGGGALLGMGFAGARPSARLRTLGLTLLAVDALIGVLVLPLGYVTALWQGIALLLLVGLFSGFAQVAVFTWIQRRVPAAYLGRTMSIFMFIFVGLAPLSAALTGWVMRVVSVGPLFALCGGALLLTVAIASVGSRMRDVADVAPAART